MAQTTQEIFPDLLDIVKNPQNYDEATRIKAINYILAGANDILDQMDAMERTEFSEIAAKDQTAALKKVREHLKNIQ